MSGVCSRSRQRLSATPTDFGIAERGGLALDVMGGAEQRIVRLFVKANALDVLARRFQTLAFRLHPGGELRRQLDQRRFGARDRIVIGVRRRPTTLRNSCGGVITSWSA